MGEGSGAPFPPLPFSKGKALRTNLTLLCWLSLPWSAQSVDFAFSPHLWGKRECQRQKRSKTPACFVHAHLPEKSNNENALLYILWTSGSFLKILSAASFSCRSIWLGQFLLWDTAQTPLRTNYKTRHHRGQCRHVACGDTKIRGCGKKWTKDLLSRRSC